MIEENGYWYERCGDCGNAVIDRKISKRQNICDECWERRAWLVRNIALGVDPRFHKIQRAMANHTGTAKRQIIKWQSELAIGVNIDNYADLED
jgi:hypothetical protein